MPRPRVSFTRRAASFSLRPKANWSAMKSNTVTILFASVLFSTVSASLPSIAQQDKQYLDAGRGQTPFLEKLKSGRVRCARPPLISKYPTRGALGGFAGHD